MNRIQDIKDKAARKEFGCNWDNLEKEEQLSLFDGIIEVFSKGLLEYTLDAYSTKYSRQESRKALFKHGKPSDNSPDDIFSEFLNGAVAEEWRWVVGHEGKFMVSNMGRIKSMKTNQFIGGSPYKYKRVHFYDNGKSTYRSIHRIVCMAFIPNPENKPQINHKNGNTHDNRVENLEWCTASENIIHAFATGLIVPKRGARNFNSKLQEHQYLEIKEKIERGDKGSEIAREYGISPQTISDIKSGRKHRNLNISTAKQLS